MELGADDRTYLGKPRTCVFEGRRRAASHPLGRSIQQITNCRVADTYEELRPGRDGLRTSFFSTQHTTTDSRPWELLGFVRVDSSHDRC